MINSFQDLSIKAKLTAVISFVSILVVCLGLIIIAAQNISQMRDQLYQQGIVNARLVGEYAAAPLAFGDQAGGDEILERLSAIPMVRNARLFGPDGVLFSSYDKIEEDVSIEKAPQAQGTRFEGNWLHVFQPIVYENVAYGAIYLRISTANLDEKIFAYILMLSSFALLLLIISFLLARKLQSVISDPITQLSNSVKAITEKEDFSIRVKKSGNDETGRLCDQFNDMMDHIVRRQNERDRAILALNDEKERAEITLSSIGDGVITTNAKGEIMSLNKTAEQVTGWLEAEAIKKPLEAVFSVSYENYSADHITSDHKAQFQMFDQIKGVMILKRKDQSVTYIRGTTAVIEDAEKKRYGNVIVFRDVSETRELIHRITYQAQHDSLTGLINRREFERRLSRLVDQSSKEKSENAILYMDLDQFKVINDTCGHVAGDELLRQLTSVMQSKIRSRDTLARMGGDEFALLLENCSPDQASHIAEELRHLVEEYRFSWGNNTFTLGASIGVVPVNDLSGDIHNILSLADAACYAAKEAGRNRIYSYTHDDEDIAQRYGEMKWVSRINDSLNENQFFLVSEPIVSLDLLSEAPRHYEILIRMKDNDGRVYAPGSFLPAAERYNMAPAIDRWVISEVFQFLAMKQAKKQLLPICAINLSGNSFGEETLLDYILEQLEISQIPANRICFEITETAVIVNLNKATQFMEALRAKGFDFALDDFGSGMSSFVYLEQLPVDFLKIDGTFIKDIARNPSHFTMVKAINEIGHVMGMRTIAEFVETQENLEALKKIRVDAVQGFLLGSSGGVGISMFEREKPIC